MKYVADRGYTDLQLNRHVEKDDELEKIYKEAGVELTEERKDYLVNKRKLYISVEEISEENIEDITPVDEVPEGEKIVDRLDIVECTKEQEETSEENEAEETLEDNNTDKEQTNEIEEGTEEDTIPVEAEEVTEETEIKAREETTNTTAKDKKKNNKKTE